jgi:hypothetical protein
MRHLLDLLPVKLTLFARETFTISCCPNILHFENLTLEASATMAHHLNRAWINPYPFSNTAGHQHRGRWPHITIEQGDMLEKMLSALATGSAVPAPTKTMHLTLNCMNSQYDMHGPPNPCWAYCFPACNVTTTVRHRENRTKHVRILDDLDKPWTPRPVEPDRVTRGNLPRYRHLLFIHIHKGSSPGQDIFSLTVYDRDVRAYPYGPWYLLPIYQK